MIAYVPPQIAREREYCPEKTSAKVERKRGGLSPRCATNIFQPPPPPTTTITIPTFFNGWYFQCRAIRVCMRAWKCITANPRTIGVFMAAKAGAGKRSEYLSYHSTGVHGMSDGRLRPTTAQKTMEYTPSTARDFDIRAHA